MKSKRAIRLTVLAGGTSAICLTFATVGAVLVLLAGLAGLVIVTRGNAIREPGFSEYPWWLFCVALFAGSTIILSSLAELPAVWMAFLALCPIFGTAIYSVEVAIFRRQT